MDFAFAVAAPGLWNTIPLELLNILYMFGEGRGEEEKKEEGEEEGEVPFFPFFIKIKKNSPADEKTAAFPLPILPFFVVHHFSTGELNSGCNPTP